MIHDMASNDSNVFNFSKSWGRSNHVREYEHENPDKIAYYLFTVEKGFYK